MFKLLVLLIACISLAFGDSITENAICTCSQSVVSCPYNPANPSSGVSASCTCSGNKISCTFESSEFGCDTQASCNEGCTTICEEAGVGFSSSSCFDCVTSSSSSSSCFPANATVQLQNGQTKSMADLQIKDSILTGEGSYSDVYMFTHRYSEANYTFVSIKTTSVEQPLLLTADHYLYVNGKLAIASTVKVGDELLTGEGKSTIVTKVTTAIAEGLYNPHTLDGNVVVNGIQTSTYTAAVAPMLAHYALWPVRLMYKLGYDVTGHAFDDGSDLIAALMPNGKQSY